MTRSDLIRLHMALTFRSERVRLGAEARQIADLRRTIAVREADPPPAAIAAAQVEAKRLRSITKDDMPPAVDDIALLLEVILFRLGASARADAWRHVGVNPNRGRELLARNHQAFDWPLWFTLREAAFG